MLRDGCPKNGEAISTNFGKPMTKFAYKTWVVQRIPFWSFGSQQIQPLLADGNLLWWQGIYLCGAISEERNIASGMRGSDVVPKPHLPLPPLRPSPRAVCPAAFRTIVQWPLIDGRHYPHFEYGDQPPVPVQYRLVLCTTQAPGKGIIPYKRSGLGHMQDRAYTVRYIIWLACVTGTGT